MRVSPITTFMAYPKAQVVYSRATQTDDLSFKSWSLKKNSLNKSNNKRYCMKNILLCSLAALSIIFAPGRYKEEAKRQGYVEPLQEKFDTKEDAINYSIGRIVELLQSEPPREYSVNLNYKDYSVESEKLGDENSVSNYSLKYVIMDYFHIKHPYISLHGHPSEIHRDRVGTQTFSLQDFRSFVNNENEKESFVVNKDGKFCMLRKKPGFKPITKEEMDAIEKDYKFSFHASWANSVDVLKEGEVVHTFNDYQGMHAFWKKVGDKYNIEYYTNFGVHEGVDAYIDYYYPELLIPQEPTTHRSFKL